MDNAYGILVIILSTTLAIFLIIAIIAAVKLNQLLDQVKRITDKAENFADKAESAAELFSYTAGPAAIGRFLATVGEAMKKRKRKED